MERLHNLKAYQTGYKLCLFTYTITKSFPIEEKFALVSQMRRASYSVIATIAEGTRKQNVAERCHFYATAIASLEELKCFLELAKDLGYVSKEHQVNGERLAVSTAKMLYGLRAKLRSAVKTPDGRRATRYTPQAIS